MCKIISDTKKAEELINAFFFPVSSVKMTLIHLCDENRHGIAYGSDCTLRLSTWYENDKKSNNYIGDGNVEIIGWEPYFEKDIKVVMTNKEFYEYLKKYTYKYEKEYQETREELNNYMNLIKIRLNIGINLLL